MNTSPNQKPFITTIIPILFLGIWSGGALFAKLGLQYANIWSFLWLRATLALGLLLVLLVTQKQRMVKSKLDKKSFGSIVVSGFLLQVGYLVLYFYAINTQLSLGIIILILGIQPIITRLLSIEKVNFLDISLLLLCFFGLALATLGYHSMRQVNGLGIILAIGALLSITFGTISQAKVTSEPIITLTLQTILAFMVFSVMVAFNGFAFTLNVYSITALLWMGAVVSVGAFLLLMKMLKYSSVEKVSTLFFLLPLLTMLLESVFFHTPLNILTIFGDILVCVSLYMYQFQPFSLRKR